MVSSGPPAPWTPRCHWNISSPPQMFPGQLTDLAVDSLQQTWETKIDQSIIDNYSVYQLNRLFIHPSINPSNNPSIHPFIYSFIHPIIHTSLYLSFQSGHDFIKVYGCHIIFDRSSTANWTFLPIGKVTVGFSPIEAIGFNGVLYIHVYEL